MTGMYPINIGLNQGVIPGPVPYGLDPKFTILPEELRRAGYTSHIIGKWHLGFCNKKYWPHHRGFDSFFGYFNGGEGYYDHINTGGYDLRNGDEVAFDANGTYSTIVLKQSY